MPDKDKVEFFVRWKGYGDDARTWESFELFAYDAPSVVQEYLVSVLHKKKEEDKEDRKEEAKGSRR